MIRIPLSAHGSPALNLTVELEEEYRSSVRLIFELGPNELVGRTPDRDPLPDQEGRAYAEGDEVGPLRDEVARLETLLEREQAFAAKLLGRLANVADERDVWRELDPQEAREVAAALVHYAGEVERVFR